MPSELLVSRIGCQTWAAMREDGTLAELRVERSDEQGSVGRIVKARVSKVLPGIQSAFLDIGLDRDAYLHASGLRLPGEEDDRDASDADPNRIGLAVPDAPIQDRLREGQAILVQVEREAFGSKGARVTSHVTLPGRFLVYLPQVGGGRI